MRGRSCAQGSSLRWSDAGYLCARSRGPTFAVCLVDASALTTLVGVVALPITLMMFAPADASAEPAHDNDGGTPLRRQRRLRVDDAPTEPVTAPSRARRRARPAHTEHAVGSVPSTTALPSPPRRRQRRRSRTTPRKPTPFTTASHHQHATSTTGAASTPTSIHPARRRGSDSVQTTPPSAATHTSGGHGGADARRAGPHGSGCGVGRAVPRTPARRLRHRVAPVGPRSTSTALAADAHGRRGRDDDGPLTRRASARRPRSVGGAIRRVVLRVEHDEWAVRGASRPRRYAPTVGRRPR